MATTPRHLITIAVGGTAQPFNAESAIRAARGFHLAAGELETLHRQEIARRHAGAPGSSPDPLIPILGRTAGATVLEALALELVLKVKLDRAGKRLKRTHDHAELFAKLPGPEQEAAEQRYQASRHPAMRATLKEALAFSAPAFEQWRYLHEHPQVQASTGEMRHAFEALAHGL